MSCCSSAIVTVICTRLIILTAFGFISLFAFDTYADIRIESTAFSVTINSDALESQFQLHDALLVTDKTIERIEKIVSVKYVISNPSNSVVEFARVKVILGRDLRSEQDPGGGFGSMFYAYLDPFIADSESEEATRIDIESLTELPDISINNWFGWTNHYHFESIRFQDNISNWHYRISRAESEPPENLFIELIADSENLYPGESVTIQFDYLSAPKSRKLLQDPQIKLESLLLMNLWAWFRSVCFVFWSLMDTIFVTCGNWGATIIMLALAIRLITIPITRFSLSYQERTIRQQAQIAPLMQEIKQNYKGIEQSEKIIELYESQNYDHLAPFKSMVGLFIQIPIFVALFNVLGDNWELSGQSFLWITDLAKSDRLLDWGTDLPYFGRYFNLLPVVMAAITIFSTWLAARHSGNDKSPTTTLFGMGAIFFVLFYSFPAALVLYWLSSNLFQLVQQSIENRIKSNIQ